MYNYSAKMSSSTDKIAPVAKIRHDKGREKEVWWVLSVSAK